MIQHISNYQQNDKIPMFKSTETFRQPQQRNLVSGNFQHKVHCVNSISILPMSSAISDVKRLLFMLCTPLLEALHVPSPTCKRNLDCMTSWSQD